MALLTRSINLEDMEPGVFDIGELLLDKDDSELKKDGKNFSFGTVLILGGFVYFLAKNKIDAMISQLAKK